MPRTVKISSLILVAYACRLGIMSNPYRVVDIKRNEFEVFPDFVTPKATTEKEVKRRHREGPSMPGWRAQHLGILRATKMLEIIPTTDHKTLRYLTNSLACSFIGAAGYDLFPDETVSEASEVAKAKMRKPVWMPRFDTEDPEQRPTAIQLLDDTISLMAHATIMAKKLPRLRKTNPELARNEIIQHGRILGTIGYRLACWDIADEISYNGANLSNTAVQHLGRERILRQFSLTTTLAADLEMRPSIRQLAHPFSPVVVHDQLSGIAGVVTALEATKDLVLPS